MTIMRSNGFQCGVQVAESERDKEKERERVAIAIRFGLVAEVFAQFLVGGRFLLSHRCRCRFRFYFVSVWFGLKFGWFGWFGWHVCPVQLSIVSGY